MSRWAVRVSHEARNAETKFTVEAPDKATAEEYARHRAPGFKIDQLAEIL